jgi:LmbE family N-acetylglucosaminyl deacetylase
MNDVSPESRKPLTLMTVHAHPDDETITTGGVMAKAVRDGHRVILITATRGEQGEIVIPAMDAPDNHRRLGEIRMAELESAMDDLGVTEWDNLGYRDSDMKGRPANADPRSFWQADLDEAIGRLVWFIRRHRPDVMTTYDEARGYDHPDHVRVHEVGRPAFDRAGDPAWYPEQLTPQSGGSGPTAEDGGLEPWAPRKIYEPAFPTSLLTAMAEQLEARGEANPWAPSPDATPEELAEYEKQMARALTADELITTRVDISEVLQAKWDALHRHATQIGDAFPLVAMGLDGWREFWSSESFILRASRDVDIQLPETDLFAGLS